MPYIKVSLKEDSKSKLSIFVGAIRFCFDTGVFV